MIGRSLSHLLLGALVESHEKERLRRYPRREDVTSSFGQYSRLTRPRRGDDAGSGRRISHGSQLVGRQLSVRSVSSDGIEAPPGDSQTRDHRRAVESHVTLVPQMQRAAVTPGETPIGQHHVGVVPDCERRPGPHGDGRERPPGMIHVARVDRVGEGETPRGLGHEVGVG